MSIVPQSMDMDLLVSQAERGGGPQHMAQLHASCPTPGPACSGGTEPLGPGYTELHNVITLSRYKMRSQGWSTTAHFEPRYGPWTLQSHCSHGPALRLAGFSEARRPAHRRILESSRGGREGEGGRGAQSERERERECHRQPQSTRLTPRGHMRCKQASKQLRT